jgi:hypothetical protein
LIFEEFGEKISFKKFWGFRALNIQSFKKMEGFGGVVRCIITI